MSGAWWLEGARGIGVSDGSKPEAVGPEDSPETGCSLAITLLPV